jgi:hypothetical protein
MEGRIIKSIPRLEVFMMMMVGCGACSLVDGYPTFQMNRLPSSKRDSASPLEKLVHVTKPWCYIPGDIIIKSVIYW